MKRRHLFEFHEMDFFPSQLRDYCTDILSYFAGTTKVYQVIAEKLWEAVACSHATNILDLCSGGATPILSVQEKLLSNSHVVPVFISDKSPNLSAFRHLEQLTKGRVSAVFTSVDAMNVPSNINGFRTLFTSFHHFNVHDGEKIILDAIKNNQGIGIFEYTERNFLLWGSVLLVLPFYILCITPFVRPFSWKRLFWTYFVPIIPAILVWDGFVSCLRTYSPVELTKMVEELPAKMVEQVPAKNYKWEVGRAKSVFFTRVTYLIGYPVD